MNKKRPKLITTIQILIILSIITLSSIILIFQVLSQRNNFKNQSLQIKADYNLEQKEKIHAQVVRVADLINYTLEDVDSKIKNRVEDRGNEAFSVVNYIYNENVDTKSEKEIQKMIVDSLRPIRFENNLGYFFIIDKQGEIILLDEHSDLEGKNMLVLENTNSDIILQKFIEHIKTTGEGFASYPWFKPKELGNSFNKLSYVKLFEPYNWFVGTGLYVEDVLEETKSELLYDISKINFEKDGYIFVNKYNGDALVSEGKYLNGKNKLWEVLLDEDKGKDLFNKELDAALKPNGEFINYSITKKGDSLKEYPKISFIYGIDQLNWIVGAGVYLDDVEEEIAFIQKSSYNNLITNIKYTIIITLIISLVISIIFICISNNLKTDVTVFLNFFDQNGEDRVIDLDAIKYRELLHLAVRANNMQKEKYSAELKLRDSEMKFRLLAENSQDLIFKMSLPDGHYDYISPASMTILGYTPEEFMSEPFFVKKCIHPDWKVWLAKKLEGVLEGHLEKTLEYPLIKKTGEVVWINQKVKIIKDEQGKAISIVGRVSDDTARKNIEDQLRHKYRLDAIGQIAGGVAHDFNNILGGIMNASQVLSSPKREMDEKSKLMVSLIRQSAKRASELTSKLSSFSRKRSNIHNPMNLHKLIEETLGLLKESLPENFNITTKYNATNQTVLGDGAELQSALLNLVINSSHAMPEGGVITLETNNVELDSKYCSTMHFNIDPGQYIQLEVKDTGTGIKKQLLNKIFEPFFSTKEPGEGTGLGLATVYAVIVDHNGAIYINSEINVGTSFFILIPTTDEIQKSLANKSMIDNRGGTILVVDDEEIIRVTTRNMLEDMGFSVLTAENGQIAVDIYKEKHFEIDIVIMDMIMPVMNGHDALYKFMEIEPQCKVILASGFTSDEDLEELRNAGLSGFLKKPFTDVELSKMISLSN